MFSGIVEATGRVIAVREEQGNKHFTIEAPFTQELRIDQSIAHNGVCLTVVELEAPHYTVTAIRETLIKSNLGEAPRRRSGQPGTKHAPRRPA